MMQNIFVTLHENTIQLPNKRHVFSYLDGSENAGRMKERKIIASDTELCFAIHPYALFLESYHLGYLHRAKWTRGSLVTLGCRWALWDVV